MVGEAEDGEEAVRRVRELSPDVVVLDVRLPGMSGVEACREIRAAHPKTRVIMLTSYPDEEAVFSSVLAGASGYVLKQIGSAELLSAIRRVSRGESLLDPSVTGTVLERMRRGAPLRGEEEDDRIATLTAQERRILALIAEGKTNREIGEALFLSEKTVRNYVSNLLGKLGLANRAEAAAFAVRRRLAQGEGEGPFRH